MIKNSQEKKYEASQTERAMNALQESRKINSGVVQFQQSLEDMSQHSVIFGKTRDGMRGFDEHVMKRKTKTASLLDWLIRGQ